MSKFMSQLTAVCNSKWHAAIATPLLKFVMHGDREALEIAKKNVKKSWDLYWLDPWEYLGPPAELTDEEKRAMEAAVYLGKAEDIAKWLKSHVEKSPADEETYLAVYLAAFGSGKTARTEAAATLIDRDRGEDWFLCGDGRPNAAGRFLLSLSDPELAAAVKKVSLSPGALRLLLQHASSRVPPFLTDILHHRFSRYSDGPYLDAEICGVLLKHDAARYEKEIAAAFHAEMNLGPKFNTGVELARVNREKYHAETRKAAQAMLAGGNWGGIAEHICPWLIEQYREGALEDIAAYLRHDDSLYHTEPVLCNTIEAFAEAARPAVVAALENPNAGLRLIALEQLIKWARKADRELVLDQFRRNLAADDPKTVVNFIAVASRSSVDGLDGLMWPVLEHKSKPVRSAAARVLGRLGDASVGRAKELLVAKKASVRSAAVSLLAVAETPAAAQALEARLDDETDEEVRDQILLALDQVWEAQGKKITRKQIDQRIARTAEKLEKPVTDWIDEKKLPPLCFAKGREKLKPQAVRYLLYRQSRAREMKPDIECKPLYALLDCKTSGDFAMAVLRMFLGSKMAAEDRWALALAGILGDDRIVPALMGQIRVWVDANRGKLAEYASQALALLGSDVALCAVDALSIRYRSKQKNIGKAAAEAFAEAAERQGITVDELGDRAVPWLGFEAGKPRVVGQGEKQVEARIGLEFKLEFRDMAKGKKITSLPSWVPAEVKNEYKDLAATLREVLKGQLVRIENLMVRQFRWPLGRWQELFLVHPVLFPFATRLVWGIYDGGRLRATFRALEDRTLTNAADEAVTLPGGKANAVTVGIVHPLELSADDRRAWSVHLADYNVQSPFQQLERPVVYPTTDEKPLKMSSKYKNTDLNAMTFKGRAERLGWQRGSVCDGGGIPSYRKSFPGAGADVILETEGMFIGVGMDDSIKLGRFCFVKSGSVLTGSYVYDEPSDEKDPRLLSFGEVPPIVFSETLGDLARIAGTKEAE
jgi:hypothetical protein